MIHVPQDRDLAQKWVERAAKQGHAPAQLTLGRFFQENLQYYLARFTRSVYLRLRNGPFSGFKQRPSKSFPNGPFWRRAKRP